MVAQILALRRIIEKDKDKNLLAVVNSQDCTNMGTRGQTQKRKAERDVAKNYK